MLEDIHVISTLTINTAIDNLFFIDALNKNNTNRIQKSVEVLGGKGTHVSLNLSELGVKSQCFGVVRGEVGGRIHNILNARSNIDVKLLCCSDGNSRQNYALIENDGICTLIVEKGVMLERTACEQLLELIDENTQPGDYMVLSGDASNTEVPFIYNLIMERLKRKNVKFFLDTSSQNLIEGLKAKPFLVKPNMDELSQIFGSSIVGEQGVVHAMDQILSTGVQVVTVSCGGDGSYVKTNKEAYRVYPLAVNVKNTIGCGDAYLSGLVYGFSKNEPLERIIRYAAAISAATAESELTVGFDLQRAMSLVDQVRIEQI